VPLKTMSRRRASFNIHGLLLGLLVLVAVTGGLRFFLTGGSAANGKTRIAFWNGFTGPDGVVMLKIIENFNKQNPDVEVVMQRIPWATYYNKLTVAGSDGRGPEIFVVHADALARIRRAGFVEDVTDLYEGPDGLPKSDFDESVIDQVDFDGRSFAVPLDIHPQGLYLNKQMLKDVGFVDERGEPRAPKTKAEFLDLMRRTTKEPGGDLKEKQWGFALTGWGPNFRSLIPQFGGGYVDEDGNPTLNRPENVKALEFLGELTAKKLVPPPDNGLGWFGFRTKRAAMVWDGVFMLGDLIRLNDLEYMGAPLPAIGDRPGTLANSHLLCLKKKLSDTERAGAARFVKYLSEHSLEWAAAGQVPTRKSVRANPEFKKLQVQSAFAEQIPTMLYPPRTPVIFEFMLEVDRATEKVLRGQATAKEALDEAQRTSQTVIDRDRREYPESYENGTGRPL
jgi:multiple sugar transport system substrate-binding protein